MFENHDARPVSYTHLDVYKRQSRYVLFAAGPDHRQLAQADSDVTDVRDVLTKAAVLCGSPEFKGGGYKAVSYTHLDVYKRQI